MNPVSLVKALILAGVFALVAAFAAAKVTAQLPKVRGAF